MEGYIEKPPKTPLVSVIMNCLNCEEYLVEALDSVCNQTYQNWEIVFWDNASCDSSGRIAQRYGKKVRYYRSEETVQLGRARNMALQQSRGEFIAFLDCDDVWLPQKLERQLDLFERDPDLAMVYSNTIFFDESGDKVQLFQLVSPHRGYVFGELLRSNFISTETMLLKKDVLEGLRYVFDEDFTMVMDYDLSLRIAYHHKLDYIEVPLSKWRMHAGSETSKRRSLVHRENQRMLERLTRQLPSIEVEYGREVSFFRKTLEYQFALDEWEHGSTAGVRRRLRPYLMNDVKFFVTFVMSLQLPFAWYQYLKSLLWKLRIRLNRRQFS